MVFFFPFSIHRRLFPSFGGGGLVVMMVVGVVAVVVSGESISSRASGPVNVNGGPSTN